MAWVAVLMKRVDETHVDEQDEEHARDLFDEFGHKISEEEYARGDYKIVWYEEEDDEEEEDD